MAMPLTMSSAEYMLTRTIGPLMIAGGLDGTTHDGTNADLAMPIAGAVSAMGYVVEDYAHPVDADLAAITGLSIPYFLLYAELRVCFLLQGQPAFLATDIKELDYEEKKSQYPAVLSARIKALQAAIDAIPDPAVVGVESGGIRVGQLSAGTCDPPYRPMTPLWPTC